MIIMSHNYEEGIKKILFLFHELGIDLEKT